MKKILGVFAAVVMTLGIAAPAQAATSGLVCNQYNITGALTVFNSNGLWGVTGNLNDPSSHQWGWDLWQNGDRFTNGSHNGSFSTGTYGRTNRPGNDTFRFHVWNASGTINCNAYATVS